MSDEAAIDQALRGLVDGDERAAIPRLVAMGRPALERLLALMAGTIQLPSSVDWRDRSAAVEWALLEFGRSDLDSVLEAVRARGWEETYSVVSALGRLSDPRLVPLLLRAAASKDSTLREFAIGGLARQTDPRATDVLIAALKDRAAGIRLTAAEAVGDRGDARAIGPLEEVIAAKQNARHPGIVQRARASLAKLRGRQGKEPA